MPWSDPYKTVDSETGKETTAAHKTDENGHVSDFIQGIENDTKEEPKNHGHAWNLNSEVSDDGEDPIGGRDVKESKEDDKE